MAGPDPRVKILSLPEWLPDPSNQTISPCGAGGLHPTDNFRQLFVWLQNKVNMVRHDRPCEKVLTAANSFSIEKRLDEQGGDVRIFQPSRAIRGAFMQSKRPQGVGITREYGRLMPRERPCQAPGHENNRVRGNPVWKSPSPEHGTPLAGGKTASAPHIVRRRGVSLTKIM
jgi:hypothetical protein